MVGVRTGRADIMSVRIGHADMVSVRTGHAGMMSVRTGRADMVVVSSFSLILPSLELSDTQVYEPYIRALLVIASYFCDEVVLKSRTDCLMFTPPSLLEP